MTSLGIIVAGVAVVAVSLESHRSALFLGALAFFIFTKSL